MGDLRFIFTGFVFQALSEIEIFFGGRSMKKRTLFAIMGLLLLAGTVFAGPGKQQQRERKPGDKYRIALSNNFMGNDWRQNMIWVTRQVMAKSPYKEKVDLTIVNTDNNPETQSASIDAMIRQGYDAIIIDCASPRGLNPAIDRAVNAGIVVVTFDQVADNPNSWNIETDFSYIGETDAKFIVAVLGGKGNVVMDRGLPGAAALQLLYDGAMKVFKQYPDIKIVSEFDGMFAEGPSEQGAAAAITANSQIDAVFSQGYVAPIGNAFLNARRPLPVITAPGIYQSDLRFAVENNNPTIHGDGNLVGIGAMAIQIAIDVLEGRAPAEKHILLKDAIFYSTKPDLGSKIGATLRPVQEGYFPDRPPSVSWPVLPADFPVQLTMDESVRQ
jgi:ribose transport system substrate-binding protein